MKNVTATFLLSCFCIFNFHCEKEITIPAPVYPTDAARLSPEEADNLIFSWNAMKFRGQEGPSTYKVYVYETDSVSTQNEARQYFFSNILEQETKQAYLAYPPTSPKLSPGKAYTWKVALVDSSGAEVIIKDFSSFALEKSDLKTQDVPLLPESFCTDYYMKVVNDTCILTSIFVECPTVIHVATGSAAFGTPAASSNRSVSYGAANYMDGCIKLDSDNNTIEVTCKYKVTVPFANFGQLGNDSVIFKVFKEQVQLPDTDFEMLPTYESLRYSGLGFPDPFVLTPLDYDTLVCIDGSRFAQALILIQATFPIEFQDFAAYPKQYTMVFDFVSIISQELTGQHVHTSNDSTYAHSTIDTIPPCGQETAGSYRYYKCLEDRAGAPGNHLEKHIVMISIPIWLICGDWNRYLTVPVEYQAQAGPILPH